DVSTVPCHLRVVAEIRAGAKAEELPPNIRSGEAAAIMTGAPTPNGADAIIMVEYTTRSGDRVEITRGVQAGENVVPTGSEAKAGEVLLRAGTRIGSAPMA